MPLKEPGGAEDTDATFLPARDAALRFLGYRSRSEAEVRVRLARRHSPQVIDRVIAVLRQQGYLDDEAFARQWRSRRERLRPRGSALLRRELLQLGVSSETANEALTGFDEPRSAYRAAKGLALRLKGSSEAQFRQRLWAHLRRRGFDAAVIGDTVQLLWRELADLLHGDEDPDGQKQ